MFGWELPPNNTGGLGIACQGLAKSLSKLGTNISFALPQPFNHPVQYMKILHHNLPGIKVTAINSLLQSYASHPHYETIYSKTHTSFINRYAGTLYQEAMRYAEIAKSWAKVTPHQIIHAHDWMTFPAAMAASCTSNKPWIAHVHATEHDRTGGNVDQRIADIEYQGLNKAEAVIAVSNYTKQIIHDKYSVPKQKIHVVHNGIDLKDFEPLSIRTIFPHDKIVLYVGRLTFQKGVEYLLKAAQEVLATHPDTIFLVVGDGDMYQKHILEAAGLGISDRVIFTGFLTGNKLRTVYQMADVLVMPSISEPYGLVALEAIASKTPIIISNQSGVSETINYALKVDFWDTHQIAQQIKFVFDFPQLSQEMVSLAHVQASRLTWHIAAQKTQSIYARLM